MAFPRNIFRSGKFNARKVERHGIKFDSTLEADRWDFLLLMQRQGLITELKRQVTFTLFPDEWRDEVQHLKTKDKTVKRLAMRGIKYVADFQYYNVQAGSHVVEDTKGMTTPEYKLKEKLMHFVKGIDIVRVTKSRQSI